MTLDHPCRSEVGSVTLLAVGVATTVLILMVVLADLVVLIGAHIQATVAADAAALAAAPITFDPTASADRPCEVASAFASANGATLATCVAPPDRSWNARTAAVTVVVTADLLIAGSSRVTGRAAAEFRPVDLGR